MYEVIFTHRDFIAVNKPPGIDVHSSDNSPGLVVQLEAQLGQKLYLVHRLDKVTSGILLLATSSMAAATIAGLFQRREMHKYYLALSDAKPRKKQGLIAGDMQRSRNGTWKLCKSQDNPAITQFFSTQANALRAFLLKPASGKTHQLRVALKSLGSPILGDTAYKGSPADRTYLHAHGLDFGYEGEAVCIRCWPDLGEHFAAAGLLFAPLLPAQQQPWPVLPGRFKRPA